MALQSTTSPWRRFFARWLDLMVYSILWDGVLVLAFHVNLQNKTSLQTTSTFILSLLIMLLLEPVLLSYLGTTLGKWLLGLHVCSTEDRRLSLSQAFNRTWHVLLWGEGLTIPFISYYRWYKSYNDCVNQRHLPWETNNVILLKDKKPWRIAAFLGTCLVSMVLFFGLSLVGEFPKHRAPLTIATFSDNFNTYMNYYGVGIYDSALTSSTIAFSAYSPSYIQLNTEGEWVNVSPNQHLIIQSNELSRPDFQYVVEDGLLKEVYFEVSLENSDIWVPNFQNEIMLSYISLARAQKGYNPLANGEQQLLHYMEDTPFTSFSYTSGTVQVTSTVEHTGYMSTASPHYLLPLDDTTNSFYLRYSVRLP